jgi:hypothetical protein
MRDQAPGILVVVAFSLSILSFWQWSETQRRLSTWEGELTRLVQQRNNDQQGLSPGDLDRLSKLDNSAEAAEQRAIKAARAIVAQQATLRQLESSAAAAEHGDINAALRVMQLANEMRVQLAMSRLAMFEHRRNRLVKEIEPLRSRASILLVSGCTLAVVGAGLLVYLKKQREASSDTSLHIG